MLTCPCNVDPLTPHFYIVKPGFTVVYIFFLIFALKHRLCHRNVKALLKKTGAGHSLYLPGGSRPQYGRHICPPQSGLELTTTP